MTDARYPTARTVAKVLFAVPACADGEPSRACRWCVAEAVAAWARTVGLTYSPNGGA